MSSATDRAASTVAPAAAPETASAPVIVDLGKQRRKAVKRLRRGEGPLLEDVMACIQELQASGRVAAGAQPVVVIVRPKARRNGLLGLTP